MPDTVASPAHSQSWSLDTLGNFAGVTSDGVTQARSHNAQNEVTSVNGSAPQYDANGSLTQDDAGRTYAYDAWDRLVEVTSG